MLRDRGPADVREGRRQLTGGPLLVTNEPQQTPTGRIGQSMRDQVDPIWRGAGRHVSILLHITG
jgi:hypothetical protein